LLSNAIKYRSPNRKLQIRIKSYLKDGGTWLEFTDNGLGINMKVHGHKLFGLRKTFHDNPDAKGFGLFITKSQIEAVGGMIYAESTQDRGTTFFVKFNAS
jgi:signal transduction histidine kinase